MQLRVVQARDCTAAFFSPHRRLEGASSAASSWCTWKKCCASYMYLRTIPANQVARIKRTGARRLRCLRPCGEAPEARGETSLHQRVARGVGRVGVLIMQGGCEAAQCHGRAHGRGQSTPQGTGHHAPNLLDDKTRAFWAAWLQVPWFAKDAVRAPSKPLTRTAPPCTQMTSRRSGN